MFWVQFWHRFRAAVFPGFCCLILLLSQQNLVSRPYVHRPQLTDDSRTGQNGVWIGPKPDQDPVHHDLTPPVG